MIGIEIFDDHNQNKCHMRDFIGENNKPALDWRENRELIIINGRPELDASVSLGSRRKSRQTLSHSYGRFDDEDDPQTDDDDDRDTPEWTHLAWRKI